tara:strand:- start:329 stop:832 length:504 start_codon:yes stop_codon:yes gene_type:complete
MPWNKDGTRKESAFYLKSGNTTPFKQMGASPVKYYEELEAHKASKAVKRLAKEFAGPKGAKAYANYLKNIAKSNIVSGTKQAVTGVTRALGLFKESKMKNIAKPFVSTSKHLAKLGGGLAGAAGATALAIPLALESFTKRSIKRKKEGKSGFNISKTSTNKPFTFNK